MNELFLTCVMLFNGVTGVVVTRNIIDNSRDEKQWVIVETKNGSESSDVEDLKTIPCSKANLNELKNKDFMGRRTLEEMVKDHRIS